MITGEGWGEEKAVMSTEGAAAARHVRSYKALGMHIPTCMVSGYKGRQVHAGGGEGKMLCSRQARGTCYINFLTTC